jgi:hypothetical protein
MGFLGIFKKSEISWLYTKQKNKTQIKRKKVRWPKFRPFARLADWTLKKQLSRSNQ